MNLKDIRELYYDRTGKLSDITRQLNFAGIAVVWIFRIGQNNGGIPFASCLLLAIKLFVISLCLDLLHYAYAAIAWGTLHGIREGKGIPEDTDIGAPFWINWPALFFFWMKIIVAVSGYAILITYIGRKL